MRFSGSVCARVTGVLGIVMATGILAMPSARAAEQAAPTPVQKPSTEPVRQPPIAASREEWRAAMKKLAVPRKGCFKSSFPRVEWQEVPCAVAAPHPFPRRGSPAPDTVGNGTDFSARVAGSMSSAEGSFDPGTVVPPGETGQSSGSGGSAIADAYSLQLNTNTFNNPQCGGVPSCGWQQVVFSNKTLPHQLIMQYWLIGIGTCPSAAWTLTGSGCFINSGAATTAASEPATNLPNMTLTLTAVPGGLDTATLWDGSNAYTVTNNDSFLNLSSSWTDVEYNVVGDCCFFSANFAANTTMIVRDTTHNGTTNAPMCELEGFTGEVNNLTLVGTPALGTGPSPAIVFTQSNVPGTPASCSAASGIGDVHLTTLSGLYYDFQAAGDFLQLADGDDFAVQTRQVSGAPNWPNADINKEVGARFGKTRVAICQAPTRVEIDGRVRELKDGQSVTLGDGTVVWRNGEVYSARGANGDGIRADVVGPYINLYVGLGHAPTSATRGLMVNPNGNPNQIATRSGAVLNEPVSFDNLYGVYGDSWRVPREESLMCKDERIETGNPKAPFYAGNLEPQVRERAQKVCNGAGVKVPALLESCIIDVAVLGNENAAKVFTTLPAPVKVGQAGMRCRESEYGKCLPSEGERKY